METVGCDLRVTGPRQNRLAFGIGAFAIENDVGILQLPFGFGDAPAIRVQAHDEPTALCARVRAHRMTQANRIAGLVDDPNLVVDTEAVECAPRLPYPRELRRAVDFRHQAVGLRM